MKIIAGIEAGGTKVNCGLGDEKGNILDMITIPTTTPDETISKIIDYFKDKKFDIMGVASFGPIDPIKSSKTYGYITKTPKPYWTDTNLIGRLKEHFDVEMVFDTDVNAAALAENLWGAGIGLQNILYLTIGTGIGGGAIVHGKMLQGLTHPEMGHIIIKNSRNAEGICPFHKDCLEGLASGPAIEKRAGKKAYLLDEKDPLWIEIANDIAEALVNYILILSPQKIILGGGVMKQKQLFPLIRKKVVEKLNGYVHKEEILNDIDNYIVFPKLGDFAGFYGSIALGV